MFRTFYNSFNKLCLMITRPWQVKITSMPLRLTAYPVINYLPSVSYRSCLSRRKNRTSGHNGRWIRPRNLWTLYAIVKLRGWNCELEKKRYGYWHASGDTYLCPIPGCCRDHFSRNVCGNFTWVSRKNFTEKNCFRRKTAPLSTLGLYRLDLILVDLD